MLMRHPLFCAAEGTIYTLIIIHTSIHIIHTHSYSRRTYFIHTLAAVCIPGGSSIGILSRPASHIPGVCCLLLLLLNTSIRYCCLLLFACMHAVLLIIVHVFLCY